MTAMRCGLGMLLWLCASTLMAANFQVTAGGSGFVFTPRTLTVQVGDTVTFRNAGGFHNVVSQSANFRCAEGCDSNGGNGDPSSSGWSVTLTFNRPGTFDFYCEPHGSPGVGMAGTVTVQGAAAANLGPGYTGTWFDPAQSGHGIFVEILPGDLLLAYWFTFTPQGQQAWFGGVGPISGNTAAVPVVQTTGGRFIPNFDPAQVSNPPWGTLNFTFTDCQNGKVDFNSTAGFGTGSMTLKRLTTPAGVSCTTTLPAVTVAP